MLFKDVLPLLATKWIKVSKVDLSDERLKFNTLVEDTCSGLRVDVKTYQDKFDPILNLTVNSIESDPDQADIIVITLKETK